MNQFDLIVVGGGAAGLMGAVRAGERGLRVLLLEKGAKLGRKILISGGGRCNITNNKYSSIRDFLENYPRGKKFLIGPFNRFSHQDLMNWFKAHGLEIKTEEDGRVFPVSNNSASVLEALTEAAHKNKVEIITNQNVIEILHNAEMKSVSGILLSNKQIISAKNILIACGGMAYQKTGSSGDAYLWAQSLGHKVVKPKASLTGYLSGAAWVHSLKGLTLSNVQITLYKDKTSIAQQNGALLFTHWGVTGPGIFKISALAAETEYETNNKFYLSLNLFPQKKNSEIMEILQEIKNSFPKRKADNLLQGLIPNRLEEHIIFSLKINPAKTVSEISKAEINEILQNLISLKIPVSGIRPSGEEIVTAGGISLNQVDSKNMQSKLINGLYWAGEVLDIDGFTGGYNLQAAWTTGFIAGDSVQL